MNKREKAHQLREEARKLEYQAHEEKRIAKLKEEESYRTSSKIDVFCSDDYAGLDSGKYHFYFGYEETYCPVKSHKTEDNCYEKDCDKREDCFVVSVDNKEVLRVPRSKLYPKEGEEPMFYLLAGIGLFLKKQKDIEKKLNKAKKPKDLEFGKDGKEE
jgi:hypothetical protein